MQRFFPFLLLFPLLLIIAGCALGNTKDNFLSYEKTENVSRIAFMSSLKLNSKAFSHEGTIPSLYTCDGDDINPPLAIGGVPPESKSLVLIVDDPDAPLGNFDHWILWNISPKTIEIKQNSVPEGAVEGKNDFRKTAYGGPCPPEGVHRYQFKLYALDTMLTLGADARKKDVERAMRGHVLDETVFVGLYSRQ